MSLTARGGLPLLALATMIGLRNRRHLQSRQHNNSLNRNKPCGPQGQCSRRGSNDLASKGRGSFNPRSWLNRFFGGGQNKPGSNPFAQNNLNNRGNGGGGGLCDNGRCDKGGGTTPNSRGKADPLTHISSEDKKVAENEVKKLNAKREAAGLQPVELKESLCKAAKRHSDDMARSQNMDHTGSDKSSPFERMQEAGFQGGKMAENVAWNQGDDIEAWDKSPGHHSNQMDPDMKYAGYASTDGYGTLTLGA